MLNKHQMHVQKRNTVNISSNSNLNSKSKTKNRKWKEVAKDFLEGYMKLSSLHGCKYIADPSPWKSFFWVCIMIASIVFCAIFIKVQMRKFQDTVLTTTISSTADPVWTIPFPAVTICNNIVVSKTGADEIKAMLETMGIEAEKIENYLHLLSRYITHEDRDIKENIEAYRNISTILNKLGYNSDRIMYEVALPCEKQFTFCQWKMNRENCSNLFYMIKTSRGYCCSFNAYGATTYRQKYQGNTSKIVHFAGSAGKNTGLVVTMNVLRSENFSSISPIYGFDVYIHDGQDYPDFSLFAKTILPSTSQTISLTPSIIDSNPSVRGIRPYARDCRFEDEYKLTWSPNYNFQSCLHECKAGIIYSFCKCIPYYYPSTGTVKTCDLDDLGCLKKYQITDQLMIKHLGKVTECDCLPDCNDVRYEMSLNTVTSRKMLDENTSTLRVHYSTISCIRYSKDVYFTWDMFVAAVGGIFGLCLGGSIISMIEFFYYIITYFTCNSEVEQSKLNIKNKQKISKERDEGYGIRILYPVFEYTP